MFPRKGEEFCFSGFRGEMRGENQDIFRNRVWKVRPEWKVGGDALFWIYLGSFSARAALIFLRWKECPGSRFRWLIWGQKIAAHCCLICPCKQSFGDAILDKMNSILDKIDLRGVLLNWVVQGKFDLSMQVFSTLDKLEAIFLLAFWLSVHLSTQV